MSQGNFPKQAISDARFVQAVRSLKKHSLWFGLPSTYQIKIGKYNYFWTTEKITNDDGNKIGERGIDAFIDLVKRSQSQRAAPRQQEDARSPATTFELPPLDLSNFGSSVPPPWE